MLADGEPPSDEKLAEALDQLALTYHQAPEGQPADDDREPPEWDIKARHAALGERFPQLGMYAVSDPSEVTNDKAVCGDAIDDLTDIERDLSEVVWRFENMGAEDAHWHFKLLYRSHWGMHLRELALYLHANTW